MLKNFHITFIFSDYRLGSTVHVDDFPPGQMKIFQICVNLNVVYEISE